MEYGQRNLILRKR